MSQYSQRIAAKYSSGPVNKRVVGMGLSEAIRTLSMAGYMPSKSIALWHAQDGKCFYCERDMVRSGSNHSLSLTIDHVIARAGNAGPYLAACRDCNQMRGDMPAHNFMLVMHEIIEAQGGELRTHPWKRPASSVARKLWPLLKAMGRSA